MRYPNTVKPPVAETKYHSQIGILFATCPDVARQNWSGSLHYSFVTCSNSDKPMQVEEIGPAMGSHGITGVEPDMPDYL